MKAEYPWQQMYEAAILETDREKLLKRLAETKAAINARLQELQADHGGTSEEQEAISDALIGLTVLGKELEAWPHETGSSKA
jgi:hypothetical protein